MKKIINYILYCLLSIAVFSCSGNSDKEVISSNEQIEEIESTIKEFKFSNIAEYKAFLRDSIRTIDDLNKFDKSHITIENCYIIAKHEPQNVKNSGVGSLTNEEQKQAFYIGQGKLVELKIFEQQSVKDRFPKSDVGLIIKDYSSFNDNIQSLDFSASIGTTTVIDTKNKFTFEPVTTTGGAVNAYNCTQLLFDEIASLYTTSEYARSERDFIENIQNNLQYITKMTDPNIISDLESGRYIILNNTFTDKLRPQMNIEAYVNTFGYYYSLTKATVVGTLNKDKKLDFEKLEDIQYLELPSSIKGISYSVYYDADAEDYYQSNYIYNGEKLQ